MGRTAHLFLLSVLFLGTRANTPSPFGAGQKPVFEPKEKKKIPKKNPLLDKPYTELKRGKEAAKKSNDTATMLLHLDAMRIVTTDPEEAAQILLEMAGIYFTQEEWVKAEKAFNEFVLLYPSAKQCDYAHYKAIQCGWNLTLSFDRDQTKTQEVLQLAQQFFTDHPQSEFSDQVSKLALNCQEKLLASDVNIFNFYVKGKNYKAANARLELINKEYKNELPSSQPQILELTLELAYAQNDQNKIILAQNELLTKFPDLAISKQINQTIAATDTTKPGIRESKVKQT